MGIVNVTPDSFSDGGQYDTPDSAVAHALALAEAGADILDVGGESTRPGAEPVGLDDELERVIPVIERLVAQTDTPVSIDTSKPEVMRAAARAGAAMINDVCALRADGALEAVVELALPVCIMHMQGQPRTMQSEPSYDNVVGDVAAFLADRAAACREAGLDKELLIIDPGFGFGKTLAHNLELLAGLPRLRAMDMPILVGISRKSMLGAITGRQQADARLPASLAAAVLATERGASILRVHDVAETVDALKVTRAVLDAADESLQAAN